MLFFKPIDLRDLTIVSHSKPIKSRRGLNGYIYILFSVEKKVCFFRSKKVDINALF